MVSDHWPLWADPELAGPRVEFLEDDPETASCIQNRPQWALLSSDRAYRYLLTRTWDYSAGRCVFIGLNPSTADEEKDDPTIRRCVSFTKSFGFGSLCMVNLFAIRATNPDMLKTFYDPVGPENNQWIRNICEASGAIVCAWGTRGGYQDRDLEVLRMIQGLGPIRSLGFSKKGFPLHPLYLPKGTMLEPYSEHYRDKK